MMPYLLAADPHRRFAALIQATGMINPMYHPDTRLTLEVELANQGIQGEVLFDLLLTDGQGTTRYQHLDFDGISLSAQVPTPLHHVQRTRYGRLFTKQLTRANKDLDLSALTPAQRFAVRNGVLIESAA